MGQSNDTQEILRKLDRLERAWCASEAANGRVGIGLSLGSPARARREVLAIYSEIEAEHRDRPQPFETREGTAA